jgi:hypothetical protein
MARLDLSRLGASDCEQIRAGVLSQPINALTSLAFIPAGVLSIIPAMRATGRLRLRLAAYGSALVAVGLGSFAYHGPQQAWAGRAHDGSIAFAIACTLLVSAEVRVRRRQIWRSRAGMLAAALIVAALPAYLGGRTSSPLCDPDSSIQLHGAWHVLTAGSALAFAWAARRPD